mmetsp:Transcript_9622/g.23518  ORF Transcript_9622/g.23518 Transcript_9622/m.23518 type:complete len:238 (-) Transcript_9622:401-1114(-)
MVASSRSPLPSAANRLSRGMVYPRVFFQFEMHAGTFHASRSSLLSFSGGACRTGTGSSAGPLGALRCMCLGGCMGSICLGTMRMMRFDAWGLYPGASSLGVYRMNCVRAWAVDESVAADIADPVGLSMATLCDSRADRARCVRSAVDASSSLEGRATSSCEGLHPRRSECFEYTFLSLLVPPVTMASYETLPVASTVAERTSRVIMARPLGLFPPVPPPPPRFSRWGLPMCRGYCAT